MPRIIAVSHLQPCNFNPDIILYWLCLWMLVKLSSSVEGRELDELEEMLS